jgi:hypothetical protein
MAPKGQVRQTEMKRIFKFEKYFHMNQFTQVSDVAHGPLVDTHNPLYYHTNVLHLK